KYISHGLAVDLMRNSKTAHEVMEIFNRASNQRGFDHNNTTYAVLLYKLARFRNHDSLDNALHRMTYETCRFHEGIFLTLMKHFAKLSMADRVVEMFHRIHPITRSKPSPKAITTCLNLLVEANEISLARALLLGLRRDFRLVPNSCIFNILVKYHCRNGDMGSAFDLLKEMDKSHLSSPNLITYSTLMDGLCRTGKLREAVVLLEEMISKRRIVPDALTYNLLISGFCRTGKTDEARKIIAFMEKNGCPPNVVNYSTLMNGLCSAGKIEEARETMSRMANSSGLKPDAVAYTTLISSMCRAGETSGAIELLEEMKSVGCEPDAVTFNVILGGLCREGRSGEAVGMVEGLHSGGGGGYYNHRVDNKGSYRIVLNHLVKEGDWEGCVGLVTAMMRRGFVPHFGTSNELVVGLCGAGKGNAAAAAVVGLLGMGFQPADDTWSALVDFYFRER
ncbi:hypothetical protein M569_05378, partial [Genlisea aurea]